MHRIVHAEQVLYDSQGRIFQGQIARLQHAKSREFQGEY